MINIRKNSGIFRKYFLSSFAIILASFFFIGTAMIVVVPSIWMGEKAQSLEETVRSIKSNTQDVLTSDYLGRENRNAVIMICNNLTQISRATDSDVFVVNESGEVVYCKDILNPEGNETYKGECIIHDQYQIPDSVLSQLKEGKEYQSIGKLDGMLAANNIVVASPITIHNEFRGAVFATQSVSRGLRIYISAIARMFIISSIFALIFTFFLSYFVSYKLTKPLREMSAAVKQYSNGDFTARVTVGKKSLIFRDRTEIDELAESFNIMADALSAQETSRRSFVSNVSHELKTPMTSIGGFIDGILDGTISKEEEKKYLKIVSDEVKRLSRLVTGMLNMSKIEAGQLDIKPTQFDISDMLFRTLLSFEKAIEEKQIDIQGLEDINENKIFADKDMINQVVYNLVDNAVKFTPEGGIISVESKADAEKAILKIRNTGKGIPDDEIEKIFERFYKIDKSRSYDVKGAGMGLFIIKQLVELHGGTIVARSEEGKYAEFILELPLT